MTNARLRPVLIECVFAVKNVRRSLVEKQKASRDAFKFYLEREHNG